MYRVLYSLMIVCATSLLLLINTQSIAQPQRLIVEPGVSLPLAKYRKQNISKIHYKLNFSIPKNIEEQIESEVTILFKLASLRQDLQLDFKENKEHLHSLNVNGAPSAISHQNEHIVIPKSSLKRGENKISIKFIAGNSSLNRNPNFLYTLFVPDRARTAFPLFDQPNLKATYSLTLSTPKTWTALGNASIKRSFVSGERKTFEFNTSDKISSYVFSFVAGEFDVVKRNVDGREMTLLHRETDKQKVARNLDAIFELHGASLKWLEDYTGIKYPFEKFDFALIPAFQYGGMEHVGAIQYRASTLFLDENPSDTELLSRANLIAHESAHMWFGNLVTMDWFNDVWTKEVYANFMAAKIVNPSFPQIDHNLNFLVRSYPAAYAVDRTEGANAIRQHLPNLNEAGTLYGGIIYNKAPIMMNQLERLLGETTFQKGIREYLSQFSDGNATWPNLIEIFDKYSKDDISSWSETWVNTPNRPTFKFKTQNKRHYLEQKDPLHKKRYWPQQFGLAPTSNTSDVKQIVFNHAKAKVESSNNLLVNIDGQGYGLFPVSLTQMKDNWARLSSLQRGALLINAYEQMLSNHPNISPLHYIEFIRHALVKEQNQLLLNLMLGQTRNTYWSLLTENQRTGIAPLLELTLIQRINGAKDNKTQQKIFFNTLQNVATTSKSIEYLYTTWEKPDDSQFTLSENDLTNLASTLAIKLPELSAYITQTQLQRIDNADRKRRFTFITPSLSADVKVRDEFFESLKLEENRAVESWVLAALRNLHHPLRHRSSEKYLLSSLELLEEIQQTGDIFFPARWTATSLRRYQSVTAAKTVRQFLKTRPNYNAQLKLKILQAADPIFRANTILGNH